MSNRKLSNSDVIKVRELIAEKKRISESLRPIASNRKIAKILGVSEYVVRGIEDGLTYQDVK